MGEIIIKKSPDIINNEVKSKENADSEDVSKDNTNPGILERISNPFHALISKESGSNTEKKSNNSCKNGPKESESHNYEQVKFNPQCMKIENNDVKSVNIIDNYENSTLNKGNESFQPSYKKTSSQEHNIIDVDSITSQSSGDLIDFDCVLKEASIDFLCSFERDISIDNHSDKSTENKSNNEDTSENEQCTNKDLYLNENKPNDIDIANKKESSESTIEKLIEKCLQRVPSITKPKEIYVPSPSGSSSDKQENKDATEKLSQIDKNIENYRLTVENFSDSQQTSAESLVESQKSSTEASHKSSSEIIPQYKSSSEKIKEIRRSRSSLEKLKEIKESIMAKENITSDKQMAIDQTKITSKPPKPNSDSSSYKYRRTPDKSSLRKRHLESESRIEKQRSNYMRQKAVRVGILKK